MVDSVKDIINASLNMRTKFHEDVEFGLPQRLQGLRDHIDYSMIKDDDVSEFFQRFSDICSFLDYDLLNFIIKRCGTTKLKNQMEAYKKEVEDFCATTTIAELIEYWRPRFADHVIPIELTSCIIELNWDPATAYVIDLKIIQHKINRVCPHERAMAAFLVHKLKPGSVIIIWLVWSQFQPQIMGQLKEFFVYNPEFVKDHKILCCRIGEHILYTSDINKVCQYKKYLWSSMAYHKCGDGSQVNYCKS